MGFASITIFNSVVYYSLNYTQVLNGVLMISTIPVLIIFFSCFTNEKNKNCPNYRSNNISYGSFNYYY